MATPTMTTTTTTTSEPIIDAINQHADCAPANRLFFAALDVISMFQRADVPADVVWTVAAADTLVADDGFNLDDHVDTGQIAMSGRFLPFRSVRRQMHEILVDRVLDELVAEGLVRREEEVAA
jgi:hypothetical protein